MTDDRDFVNPGVVASAIGSASASLNAAQSGTAGPASVQKQVVGALGALFVPSKTGDPGYADLEPLGSPTK